MKRDSLDERLKKLTILGVVFSCLATTPIVLLFIIGYVGIVPMLVGVSVTFLFVASVVFFARSSMATWASETQGDASNLAEIASAMARGDFSVQLEVSDELDQIKLALEHLSTVQKSLVRDIDTLTRNGGAIDE
ncbi:MAG: hypothetical protein FWF80_04140, partial [Defluviitaleaceae bacterium]|nr:hypothetical protein [Defluviitaleaceae bacterium]